MGDPTKFRYIWEYYAFHAAVVLLLLVELFIFIYTIRRNSCTQAAKQDYGTKWLLYVNFAGCLFVSVFSVRCGYWDHFYSGRDRNSALCRADPEKGLYASCANISRTASGHIRAISCDPPSCVFRECSEPVWSGVGT